MKIKMLFFLLILFYCEIRASQEFNVSFREGGSCLSMNPKNTILDAKKIVQKRSGIPVEHQRWLWDGKEIKFPDSSSVGSTDWDRKTRIHVNYSGSKAPAVKADNELEQIGKALGVIPELDVILRTIEEFKVRLATFVEQNRDNR